jgi:hypothetical protein
VLHIENPLSIPFHIVRDLYEKALKYEENRIEELNNDRKLLVKMHGGTWK